MSDQTRRKDLILLCDGYDTWKIMKPRTLYSADDRRYVEACTVYGHLADAMEVLGQLERGMAAVHHDG